jgi:hypothetical protein
MHDYSTSCIARPETDAANRLGAFRPHNERSIKHRVGLRLPYHLSGNLAGRQHPEASTGPEGPCSGYRSDAIADLTRGESNGAAEPIDQPTTHPWCIGTRP